MRYGKSKLNTNLKTPKKFRRIHFVKRWHWSFFNIILTPMHALDYKLSLSFIIAKQIFCTYLSRYMLLMGDHN